MEARTHPHEYRPYVVVKHFEPSGAYAASLAPLSAPQAFERIGSSIGLIAEARMLTPSEAEEVAAREHIEGVYPDRMHQLVEPIYRQETAGAVTAEEARTFHRIDEVLAKGYTGEGQRVAVLDTGVSEARAAALGARLVAKESMVSGEDWRDTHSLHGNWCIGTIAAIATEAELIAIKVLSTQSGSGSTSGIIKGIDRAVALGATVISSSLGGGSSPPLDKAVNAAAARGISMPCAAGNSQQGNTNMNADHDSPAEASGAITTAAVDINGKVAYFSSWGNAVDIAFIGVNVLDPGGPGASPGSWSGTSMATPYDAGTMALLREAAQNDGAAALKALYAGAKDTAARAYQEGHGIADAAGALAKLGAKPAKLWRVQVGAFGKKANAERFAARLKADGYDAYVRR